MAIRTDATGDYLVYTAEPAPPFTAMGWVKLTDRNDFSAVCMYESANPGAGQTGANQAGVVTDGDGTTIGFWDGADFNNLTATTAGVWVFWAFTVAVGGAVTFHLKTSPTAALQSFSGFSLAGAGHDRLILGNDTFISWANAAFGGVKVADTVLTAAEIDLESLFYMPRKAGVRPWPMVNDTVTEALADYAGAGTPWTAAGALAVEAGPPIAWGDDATFPLPGTGEEEDPITGSGTGEAGGAEASGTGALVGAQASGTATAGGGESTGTGAAAVSGSGTGDAGGAVASGTGVLVGAVGAGTGEAGGGTATGAGAAAATGSGTGVAGGAEATGAAAMGTSGDLRQPPVSEWRITEAASGQSPTHLTDTIADPVNLEINYVSATPAFGSDGNGRHLVFAGDVDSAGAFSAPLDDGDKIFDTFDGATAATLEVALDLTKPQDVDGDISMIAGITQVDGEWDGFMLWIWEAAHDHLELSFTGDGGYPTDYYKRTADLSAIASGYHIIHMVLDTANATAADRLRLYIDGTRITLSVESNAEGADAIPQNKQLKIPHPDSGENIGSPTGGSPGDDQYQVFAIGAWNPYFGGNGQFRGKIHHVALHSIALNDAEIAGAGDRLTDDTRGSGTGVAGGAVAAGTAVVVTAGSGTAEAGGGEAMGTGALISAQASGTAVAGGGEATGTAGLAATASGTGIAGGGRASGSGIGGDGSDAGGASPLAAPGPLQPTFKVCGT